MNTDTFRRNAILAHLPGKEYDRNRFTQATMVQIAQNVVCNSTHAAEQRAARWLLATRDRVGRDEFPLTQQFLAQMLGVRRPTVSEIAGRLQEAGLVRYARGI